MNRSNLIKPMSPVSGASVPTPVRVAAIAGRIAGLTELPAQSNRLEALGFDSLDRIEFGEALMDEFGIVIEEQDEKSFRTIADATELVERLLKVKT